MSEVDRAQVRSGLTDQEKGIIFGVLLGTLLGQFIAALQKKATQESGEITRVTEGRQSAYRYEIR